MRRNEKRVAEVEGVVEGEERDQCRAMQWHTSALCERLSSSSLGTVGRPDRLRALERTDML